MNTLSYGLLSLLSQTAFSGYDLMLRIQPFWPAKHSQIYPLLSQLEKDEYVRYELIAQSDKPDKKVYSLTEKGTAALQQWLTEPAADPVMRDELLLKTFCLSLVDAQTARNLFTNRLEYYERKLQIYQDKMVNILQLAGLAKDESPPFNSPFFGLYVLVQRAINSVRTSKEWCEWVLKQIPSEP